MHTSMHFMFTPFIYIYLMSTSCSLKTIYKLASFSEHRNLYIAPSSSLIISVIDFKFWSTLSPLLFIMSYTNIYINGSVDLLLLMLVFTLDEFLLFWCLVTWKGDFEGEECAMECLWLTISGEALLLTVTLFRFVIYLRPLAFWSYTNKVN